MKSILIAFVCLAVFPALGAERVTAPAGKVYTYKEVDGEKRELEVYSPEGHATATQPVPGIIFFHGGGWADGEQPFG